MDGGARSPRLGTGAFLASVVVVAFLAACQTSPAPSSSTGAAPSADASPLRVPSPSSGTTEETRPPDADEAVLRLTAALEGAGADVRLTGDFATDPVGGEGAGMCVNGHQVNAYVFDSADRANEVAARIDPADPSDVGTAIVEWVGNPRFWKSDRLIVLYLGDDVTVEAGLTSVLGPPFARGEGRAPGRDLPSC